VVVGVQFDTLMEGVVVWSLVLEMGTYPEIIDYFLFVKCFDDCRVRPLLDVSLLCLGAKCLPRGCVRCSLAFSTAP
jgi:hypothetical protein